MTTAAQRGTTTVSDKAVRRIAARAAHEIVPRRAAAAATKSSARVRGRRAGVAVELALPYPSPVAETVGRVQEHVTGRTHELTGLQVRPVGVGVTTLAPAPASPTTDAFAADVSAAAAGRSPRRCWSPRRVPMAMLTLVAAVACGALALDLILVHLAHRPPAPWRADLWSWLSDRGPEDPVIGIGAVALAVLGVLMVFLALTPGRRHLFTLMSPAHGVRAAMTRSAMALLVRDAASDVPGIGQVRVRARRRRVRVRAELAFGDRAEAHTAVREAARAALDDCHLRRTPRLRVTVRLAETWDPGPRPDTQDASADGSPTLVAVKGVGKNIEDDGAIR